MWRQLHALLIFRGLKPRKLKSDEIIQAQTEAVNGLMDMIEQYKTDAEKRPEITKEWGDLKMAAEEWV